MFTHWQAFKGINRISRKKKQFVTVQSLNEWEQALSSREENELIAILNKIEEKHSLKDLNKILFK
mgnify:CR=1 FL=1